MASICHVNQEPAALVVYFPLGAEFVKISEIFLILCKLISLLLFDMSQGSKEGKKALLSLERLKKGFSKKILVKL